MRKNIAFTIWLLGLIVTLVAACGGSNDDSAPTPTATLTSEESAYLDGVQAADAHVRDVMAEIGEALSTTWPIRERLFQVMGESDITGAHESTLRDLEQLAPPDRFKADHERLLALSHTVVDLSRQHDAAIGHQDLVDVFMTRARLGVARGNFFYESSPAFACGASPEDLGTPFFDFMCGQQEPLPGGVYGEQLFKVMRKVEANFSPRVTSFPPMMSPDELFASLLILNPEIEAVLEEASTTAAALEPPEEFADDHETLVTFFGELLVLSRQITQAARDRELDKLQFEYFPESGAIVQRTNEQFSEAFRPLVSPYFRQLDDQDS